jgi:hypothetical protein
MTSATASPSVRQKRGFEQTAAVCAGITAIGGLLYGVAFVLLGNIGLSAALLLLNGLVAAVVLIGVYRNLRTVDDSAALLGLVLGLAGSVGAVIHGGNDLAAVLHPIANPLADAPNPVDPRGLLTFGVAGLGMLIIGGLVIRGGPFPPGLGYLAGLDGVLLMLLYLARLIVLDPTSPLVLTPAALTGFLVNPALYVWIGLCLIRRTIPPS